MNINVRCPQCHEEYHLDPDMRGKLTRCKNAVCRSVFEVREVEPPAADPKLPAGGSGGAKPAPFEVSPPRHQGGTVGDLIPILPAEAVGQEPLPEPGANPAAAVEKDAPSTSAPQEAGSWRLPPPVRRGSNAGAEPAAPVRREPPAQPKAPPTRKSDSTPRKTAVPDTSKVVKKPAPATMMAPISRPADSSAAAGPVELPPGDWAPPPVRRGPDQGDGAAVPAHETADKVSAPEELSRAHRSTRVLKVMIAASLSVALAVVALLVLVVLPKSEKHQADHARQLFDAKQYLQAQEAYAQLQKDFPASDNTATYDFLQNLSVTLNQATPPITDVATAYDGLRRLSQETANESQLRDRKDHVVPALVNIGEGAAEKAKTNSDTKLLDVGRDALRLAERFEPSAAQKTTIADLRKRMNAAEAQIAYDERIKREKQELAALVGDLDELERRLAKQVLLLPELKKDADVAKLRREAIQRFQDRIAWKANSNPAERPKAIAEEREPSLVIAPAVSGVRSPLDEKDSIVFAIARGVLYALKQRDLSPVWQVRVGIDTTALPIRLPATEISPERALVLSSDTKSLTARNVQTGEFAWHNQTTAACLGRPVVVEKRVFVPTTDGRVHVFETIEGNLLGWYELGKPLTVGGVHQRLHVVKDGQADPKDYLYFPADERHVFVLDIADAARNKPCVDILEVGHPCGSLRSEPILLSREDQRLLAGKRPEEWPDLLMLYQADGLNKTRVRLLHVATPGLPHAPEPGSLAEPVVAGWPWFPPYFDSEKLVQVTDAGQLGVVGIRQLNNQDKDLFKECEQALFKGRGQPTRAQIVHVAEDDFWILAEGNLQLWHFNRFRKEAAKVWQRPLALGSPLHASQVNAARKAAFVVTQDPQKPTCWISAVDIAIDTDSSNLRRQVQLGLLCQDEPLLLEREVLVLDEGGGLFKFDPAAVPADREWQAVTTEAALPAEGATRGQFLVRSRDGKSVFAIAKGSGSQLVVRRYEPGTSHPPRLYEFSTELAGAPGAGDDCLVLAGTDGILRYLPLKGGDAIRGPDWRSLYADRDAPGHVVHLGGNEFLVTNGAKGLTHWSWDGVTPFKKICPVGDRQKIVGADDVVTSKIVAPPLVLPAAEMDAAVQVIIADARGHLSLVREGQVANQKRWIVGSSWELGGRITAGPFLRGNQVGCVVDQDRLVWIDPAGNGKLWEYPGKGDGIVGQPQVVDGLLLVAHRSGRFVGLDLATGKPLTPGYELKAKTAPAAAPVAFGKGRAFAPLTDGTVMLLSLKHLKPRLEAAAK